MPAQACCCKPHLSEDTAMSNACSLAASSMDRPINESSCAVIASALHQSWGNVAGEQREARTGPAGQQHGHLSKTAQWIECGMTSKPSTAARSHNGSAVQRSCSPVWYASSSSPKCTMPSRSLRSSQGVSGQAESEATHFMTRAQAHLRQAAGRHGARTLASLPPATVRWFT